MTLLVGLRYPTVGFIFADTRIIYQPLPLFGFGREKSEDGNSKIASIPSGFIAGTGCSQLIDPLIRIFSNLERDYQVSAISELLRGQAAQPTARFFSTLLETSASLIALTINKIRQDEEGHPTVVLRLAWFSEENDYEMVYPREDGPVISWPFDVDFEEIREVENRFYYDISAVMEEGVKTGGIHIGGLLLPVASLFRTVGELSSSVSPSFHFAGIQFVLDPPDVQFLVGYSDNKGDNAEIRIACCDAGNRPYNCMVTQEKVNEYDAAVVEIPILITYATSGRTGGDVSMDNTAKPKCPSCGATGIEHVISNPSVQESKGGDPWFEIAFCDKCGYIYGVFAKYVNARHVPVQMPTPKIL